MPRNSITKDELKCRVLKLKEELFRENTEGYHKDLAHKYLNSVLDIIEEYRV